MDVESNLGRDESVVTKGKVHWVCLIPHIFLMVLFVGFITIWGALIRMLTTELVLTNKRLYGKTGFINTKRMDSPINKLNNITVLSGLWGKIFGYGTLHVTTSSGSYKYIGVRDPDVLRSAIMEEIDKSEEARIKKQAEEMARAIRG